MFRFITKLFQKVEDSRVISLIIPIISMFKFEKLLDDPSQFKDILRKEIKGLKKYFKDKFGGDKIEVNPANIKLFVASIKLTLDKFGSLQQYYDFVSNVSVEASDAEKEEQEILEIIEDIENT